MSTNLVQFSSGPLVLAIAFACVCFAPGVVRAQDAPPTQSSDQPEPGSGQDVRLTKAPVLIKETPAQYSEQALENRIEGSVSMRLQLDVTGRVTRVEVIDGPGYGLNEAAEAAAKEFVFEPAEINGQPAPVVLGFVISFELPIMPADFFGTVIDPETEEGIEGAQVRIVYTGDEYEPAPEAAMLTDVEGGFFFGDVPPGPYAVFLKVNEYRDFETDIDLPAGELIEVTYRVTAEAENLMGSIRESGTRKRLAAVEIELLDPETDEVVRTDYTDADGAFGFRGLEPGKYFLRVSADGFKATGFDVEIVEDEITSGIYYVEADFYDEYAVRTIGERTSSEVSRRTIRLEEVRRVPGTGGDVVRVVQNLPGVARGAFVSGLIVVRGSAPQDTKVFLGGDTIPLVYHFFGGPAIVNTEMIDSIDFYPGNFSTYYGRATGGVIDLGTRSPRGDRFHGQVEIDLLDASAIFEGPVSENVSVAFAARRSYFDVFLPLVIPEDSPDVFVAPRYYDYQGWLTYRGAKNSLVELFIYGSDDAVEAVLPEGDVRGNSEVQITGVNLRNSFHRGQVRWEWRPLHLPLDNTLMVSFGLNRVNFEVAENLFAELDLYQSQIRQDMRLKLHEDFTLRIGADFLLGNSIYKYSFPRFAENSDRDPSGQGTGRPNFSPDGFVGETSMSELLPAFYVEGQYKITKNWELVPGVRADYYGPIKESSISPRVSTRYRLTPQVTMKGGVGLFTQPPIPGTADPNFGNPDITFEKAMHYAVGAEWRPTDFLEIDSTIYYRDMYDLVNTPSGFTQDGDTTINDVFANEAKGRAYGLEFLLRHYPRKRLFGWLSYTLSRAERLNLDTGEFDLYRFDQTHILTLVAGYNLPWNVDVSGRFRLVTGNPFTPVVGGALDVDSDNYQRIFGPRNSERSPLFHQLDLRVDKRFVFDTWMMGIYLDVTNVYWAKNAEGVRYNYDYTDREIVQGLPILPTIGINAQF